jgi:predicted N-acetyltransferase YhbS
MLEIRRIDEAAKPKKAFLMSGAFNPYTIGHEEAARQGVHAAKKTGHTHFYHGVGASAETEDAPLTHAQKTSVIKASHRHIKKGVKGIKMGVLSREHDNPFKQVLHLAKTGHTHVTLGLGSDQMKKTALRGQLEKHVTKHGGMKDAEGKVHPVTLAFRTMGKKRDERPLHRTELLTRLRKGDLRVAKAGHLRKAVRSGDTELAHALMPKSVNPKKYHAMIGTAQKKLAKKVNEGFVSFGEFIAETTTKKQKARAKWQRIDHVLNAQNHIWKNLSKGIDHEDQEPQAKVTHKSMRLAIDSINRKLGKTVKEDIELDPYIDPPSGRTPKFGKEYKQNKKFTHHPEEEKHTSSRNLGEIHPGYELHRHTMTVDRARKFHKHSFSIVHKASGDVAGEIDAKGGSINRKTGEHRLGRGKGLKIDWVHVQPEHGTKKVGVSLAAAAYKHLHKRGHSIKSDTKQSIGGANLWNSLRHDPETKHHTMFHDERNNKPIAAHKVPEGEIWHDEPHAQETTLVLHAKPKSRKKTVKEDIEIANVLAKPSGGSLSPRNFAKTVERTGNPTKRSGRIAKGYTLHTSTHKDDPKVQTHYIVHDQTGHVAGEVSTVSHGDEHQVIHTEVHGAHTRKKIGKSLAVLAYKHLAKKKGNLWSSSLQSPGGASVWNRLRKDPKMRGRVFHHTAKGEVSAHDVPEKHIWASDTLPHDPKVTKSKGTPSFLPTSKHDDREHRRVLGSRLVIRPSKKS